MYISNYTNIIYLLNSNLKDNVVKPLKKFHVQNKNVNSLISCDSFIFSHRYKIQIMKLQTTTTFGKLEYVPIINFQVL